MAQKFLEDDGFVVLGVLCAVEQSGGAFGYGLFEESQLRGCCVSVRLCIVL